MYYNLVGAVRIRAVQGGVAQLGEHHVRNVGVKGSNPSVSMLCPNPVRRIRAFLIIRRLRLPAARNEKRQKGLKEFLE